MCQLCSKWLILFVAALLALTVRTPVLRGSLPGAHAYLPFIARELSATAV